MTEIVHDVGFVMKCEQRFGYRILQFKLAPFHLISQLDINRLWDRVLRRSGLPILFSQGFNPRPLISFAPATPLGVESRAEYLDAFFAAPFQEEDMRAILNRELPPELRVHEIRKLHPGEKKIARIIEGFIYTFYFSEKVELDFEDILRHLPEGVSFCSEIVGDQAGTEDKVRTFSLAFRGRSLFLNPFQFMKGFGFDVGEGGVLKVTKERVLFSNEEVSLS